MELRHQDPETAIDLIRQATTAPSIQATRLVAAAGEDIQTKLYRCLKLWLVYLDLMTTHGSLESTCAVYDRMHELGLATPLLVLDHASLLEQHGRLEDAFQGYERGVRSFKHPHDEAIWEAYLTKFVQRHGKSRSERVRDLFEGAVQQAPPGRKKAVYLKYARFDEDFALASRAMKVYEDAARAVPAGDKLAVYEVYIARATELYAMRLTRGMLAATNQIGESHGFIVTSRNRPSMPRTWLMVEISVVSADIQEVISVRRCHKILGRGFLHIWAGVVIAALDWSFFRR